MDFVLSAALMFAWMDPSAHMWTEEKRVCVFECTEMARILWVNNQHWKHKHTYTHTSLPRIKFTWIYVQIILIKGYIEESTHILILEYIYIYVRESTRTHNVHQLVKLKSGICTESGWWHDGQEPQLKPIREWNRDNPGPKFQFSFHLILRVVRLPFIPRVSFRPRPPSGHKGYTEWWKTKDQYLVNRTAPHLLLHIWTEETWNWKFKPFQLLYILERSTRAVCAMGISLSKK